jgi:hypothetical protein
MSDTRLVHPLVAGYLILFDAEAAILPVNRAGELREQVVAHIEDAVGPAASDEEVAAVLRGLGPARALVAEAVAATGKRHWAARFGWKGWALIGVLLLAVAAVSGYYVKIESMKSVAPLFVEGQSGWWYPPDYRHQVTTEADMATQTTVPIRSGHRQGFFIQVFNFTRMTQTVLGSNLDGGGPNGGTNSELTSSTTDPQRSGSEPRAVRYASPPISIPPGQSRYLRITWISHGCVTKADVGGMDSVELRVRVGWTPGPSTSPSARAFTSAPAGTAAHDTCAGPGDTGVPRRGGDAHFARRVGRGTLSLSGTAPRGRHVREL